MGAEEAVQEEWWHEAGPGAQVLKGWAERAAKEADKEAQGG